MDDDEPAYLKRPYRCLHCQEDQDLIQARCGHEDDSWHCKSHAVQCDDCMEWICTKTETLKQDDSGLIRCETCRQELEQNYPIITVSDGDKAYKSSWDS